MGVLLGLALASAVVLPTQQDVPTEIAQQQGPRGTSGETREDGVGYASLMAAPPEARWSAVAIGVGYARLPEGTLVELTALDTGRTIVAMVVARDTGGALVALSPGAAQALGVDNRAAVRVRSVVATPQDERALRSGQAASNRLDAPPALLTALRRKLPSARGTAPRSIAATRASIAPYVPPLVARPIAPATAPTRGGFVVQVAALSSSARAAALARELGGRVSAAANLYRVQLGPFADTASAARARDGAVRRGYRDARILKSD